MAQRQAVTKKKALAYKGADRAGKSRILNELVELTGWHRDYARAALLDILVPLLRRDRELELTDEQTGLLMRMSAATIDRKLAGERAKLGA